MKSLIRDVTSKVLIHIPDNRDENRASVLQQAEVIVNILKFQFPR